MQSHEQLEIVSPTGQVRFYSLDPATGVVNIGQHPDNDIVLTGRDIRPFHGLIDHRNQPYLFISLDDAGDFGPEQPLDLWQRLQIGGYELALTGPAPGESIDAKGAPPLLPPRPLPPGSDATPQWQTVPGQTVRRNLTIQNSGDTPATFVITLGGAPPEWLWLSQDSLQLESQGQATVQLAVTPPPGPATRPGIYPLVWQLQSPEYPGWNHTEALYLLVEARPIVQVSRPEPGHVVSPPFRRSGRTHVTIANWGNAPIQLYVSGQERRDTCRLRFDPVEPVRDGGFEEFEEEEMPHWERPVIDGLLHADDLLLVLPPGALSHLRVSLIPRAGRLFGLAAQHHRFAVTAQAVDGSIPLQASSGTFESRPAVRPGFLLLLVFLAALFALYALRGSLLSELGRSRIEPVAVADRPAIPRLAWMAPSPENIPLPLLATGGQGLNRQNLTYAEMFQEVGQLYALDWRQLVSHAYRESRLNPRAQGASGEYGLMQILPSTWDEWAPLVQVDDPWDPYSNILVGAAYYSYIHSYFSDLGYGDHQWSLAAYNWGPERTLGLLDGGGDWFSVPLTQRMYVADILIGVENAANLAQDAEIRYPRAGE